MSLKAFGRKPSGERKKRILASPNYRNGTFRNLEPTAVMREDASFARVFFEFIRSREATRPAEPVPSERADLSALDDEGIQIVWFGHSSYLLRAGGLNVLVDPVFSGHASPVACTTKAFPGADVYSAGDMPEIDLLIITHDHYDHLDMETVIALIPKVKHVYTALGVGEHLEYWGYAKERITELDWFEQAKMEGENSITALPARHFSGRSLKRGQTLWAAYALQIGGFRIFVGGDSGYGPHFRQIGEQYGPFDLALLECGQYGKNWPQIHTQPEETAQAARDLNAKTFIPVHWGKFALAIHSWHEPVDRIEAITAETRQSHIIPMIGRKMMIG